MDPKIREIYDSNLKHYKKLIKKLDNKKTDLTIADRNDCNAFFYILLSLFKRYGCPNCESKDCHCNIMPEPHKLVKQDIVDMALWI